MSLQFVQATREDILSIQPQASQDSPKALVYGKEAFARGMVPLEERAVAIREEDRCIGAYGLIELWPGVARVWALFSSELLDSIPTVLALHVKRDLKRAEELDLHRIEATVVASHQVGIGFLEWLGFEKEGLMRRYGPDGEDFILFAKVSDVV